MSWSTSVVTPPAVEPITVDEAKDWLRLDLDDDNATLAVLIGAARRAVSTRLRRALIRTTIDLTLDGFPSTRCRPGVWRPETTGRFPEETAIRLPFPPLASVSSITYLDPAGASVVLSPSLYRVTGANPARITPAAGRSWPAALDVPGSVVVRFVAGYGPAPSDVPESIRLAIRVLVALYYEGRETPGEIPKGVDALLDAEAWS